MSASLTIDEAFDRTNPFGRYQLFIALMSALWVGPNYCDYAFFGFAAIEPAWKCTSLNDTQFDHDCLVMSQCPQANITFSPTSFYGVTEQWWLMCDRSYIPKLIASLTYVGRMLGLFLFAWPVDNLGRKWPTVTALAVSGVTGVLAACSTNWKWFAAAIVADGVSCGAVHAVIYTYSAEFTTNRFRFVLRTTGYSGLLKLSLQAAIGYLTQHWRYYLLFANIINFIAIVPTLCFVSESPRWLLQKGKDKQAKKAIDRIAKINKQQHQLPESYELETVKSKAQRSYMWDLFRNGPLLVIFTVFCCFEEFSIGFTWITAVMEMNKLSEALGMYLGVFLVALLSTVSLGVAMLELRFPNAFNRRRLFLFVGSAGLITTSTICLIYLIGKVNEASSILSVLGVFMYALAIVKQDLMFCPKIELFPTLLRANLAALCGVWHNIGAFVAPLLLIVGKWWTPLPYVVIALMSLIGVVLVFFIYPNTNKMELAELEKLTADQGQLIETSKAKFSTRHLQENLELIKKKTCSDSPLLETQEQEDKPKDSLLERN